MSWFVVIWAGTVLILCIIMWVPLSKTTVTHTKTALDQISVATLLVIAFGSLLLLLAGLGIWNVPDWLFVVQAVALALLLEFEEQRRPKGERSRGWSRIVPWLFIAYLVISISQKVPQSH